MLMPPLLPLTPHRLQMVPLKSCKDVAAAIERET
jgi:hypothetical protein